MIERLQNKFAYCYINFEKLIKIILYFRVIPFFTMNSITVWYFNCQEISFT